MVDRRDMRLCAALLVVAAIVFGKDLTVGGPRGDSAARMMDGVLIHDWIAAGPSAWVDPIKFAETQYSYYPSLGLGSAYPPGFAVAEALFFALFGISTVSAHLCVLTFALLACGGLYALMRGFTGRLQSACAVLCLMAMPSVVYWTRQVALEMPTLAVLIWSAVAACHYHRNPCWRGLLLWVAPSLAAVVFKQTAIFVFAPYGLLMLLWTIRRRVPVGHIVVAGLSSVAFIGVYFRMVSSGGPGPHVFDLMLDGRSVWAVLSPSSWLAYALWAPSQAGAWILALSAIGVAVTLRRQRAAGDHAGSFDDYGDPRRKPQILDPVPGARGSDERRATANRYAGWLILLWFFSFYAMSSIIQHKEPRYLYFGLAAFAVWAGSGAAWLITVLPVKWLRTAAAVGLALTTAGVAWRQPIDYRPDYGPLVAACRESLAGQVVLFDGLRDADFVFAVRQQLGPRGCVVVRSSKLLYACAASPRYRFESYVSSPEEVSARLREFAFDAVIVERRPLMNLREERFLRESLRTSHDYMLAASHTLNTASHVRPSVMTRLAVDVYIPACPMERQVREYRIPLPMDNRVISVDLRRLIDGIPPTSAGDT